MSSFLEIKPIYEIADKLGIDRDLLEPYGKYKVTCKWTNPVKGADIWVRDVITYTTDK